MKIFKNPWLCIFIIYVAGLLTLATLFIAKPVVKFILKERGAETNAKTDKKIKQKLSKKTHLNEYFSTGYSANTNDEEKTITTAGIICILGNGNIVHVTMTAENVDGRMKETEGTVDFIIKHQDEIFDDLIRTIVEAGQRYLDTEPKKEKSPQPQNEGVIKKKV